MLKKLIALTLIATSFSTYSTTQDEVAEAVARTYKESKAKITKALNKKNASNLGKASVFGLLSVAAAATAGYKLNEIYNIQRPSFQLAGISAGAADEAIKTAQNARRTAFKAYFKQAGVLAVAAIVSAYASYKAGETTKSYLKKTQE